MLAGQLALVVAALFSGAALFVNVAEQPARLRLEDRALLVEWQESYKRAAVMQASLAIVGCLLGVLAYFQGGNVLWLIGGLVLVANWPYTLLVIKPTLHAIDPANASPVSRKSVER